MRCRIWYRRAKIGEAARSSPGRNGDMDMNDRRLGVVYALAILGWAGLDEGAMARQRNILPLADGTYALARDNCRSGRRAAPVENSFIDVDRGKISYTEAECRISDVRIVGSSARFRERCVGEDETDVHDESWTLLSRTSFSYRGKTYIFCGRKLP
jgi:hypothetical protein